MTYAPDPTSSDGTPTNGDRPVRRGLGCAFEIVETLVLTLVIYLLIHNFVAQPFEVQQQSMMATINPGEYVLIEKVTSRFGDYQRGDIIVFHPPAGADQGNGIPFIKRIIGLPGDTVRLENGRVLITPADGQAVRLNEPYVIKGSDGRSAATLPHAPDATASWTVPRGSFFVMGDNRTSSEDSRVFGAISRESIIGRAWLRYFPLDRIGFVERPVYAGLAAQQATTSAPGS